MSELVLDVRGKACPLPVVETRRVLLNMPAQGVRVIVDNAAAVENVSRLAASLGRSVAVNEAAPGEFHLRITGGGPATGAGAAGSDAQASPRADVPCGCSSGCGNVALIAGAEFGAGEPELGATLMRMFIFTLKEVEPPPSAVVFVNSGVRLATEGSPALDDLHELAGRGIEVLSCGTCLDYYGLKELLRVGSVTNMFRIVTLLSTADRILRP